MKVSLEANATSHELENDVLEVLYWKFNSELEENESILRVRREEHSVVIRFKYESVSDEFIDIGQYVGTQILSVEREFQEHTQEVDCGDFNMGVLSVVQDEQIKAFK